MTILQNPSHEIAQSEGNILDTDYGVFIPHSVDWMQAHPDAVEIYYKKFRYAWPVLKRVYEEGWTKTNLSSFAYMQTYVGLMDRLK